MLISEKIEKIPLSTFSDSRGDLWVCSELKKYLDITRIYWINSNSPEIVRGQHAHKELSQIIFCLVGSVTLYLNDGRSGGSITLSQDAAYFLRPGVWRELSSFSRDCLVLSCVDKEYADDDYIHSFEEFVLHANRNP